MDDAKWAKYAAIGGPGFVVLTLVGAFLPGSLPAMDSSADKVANYFLDHGDAIKAGSLLMGLGSVAFVWWFGSLWRRMVVAEGGRARVSVIALLGLGLAATLNLLAAVISATLAQRIDEIEGGARFFYTMTFVLAGMAGFGVVIFLAAVTSLSYRSKLFPAWMNYLGWLSALALLVSTLSIVTDASGYVVFGFIGFFLFCAWVLLVSWDLWKSPATA